MPVLGLVALAAVIGLAAATIDSVVAPRHLRPRPVVPAGAVTVSASVATLVASRDAPDPTGPLACGSATRCVSLGVQGSAPAALFTADGGARWSLASRLPLDLARHPVLAALACPGAFRCYAAGHDSGGPLVLVTTDRGNLWQPADLARALAADKSLSRRAAEALQPQAIGCSTRLRCLVALGGYLAATADGGRSWHLERLPGAARPVSAIDCPAVARCLLLAGGRLFLGTGSGARWSGVSIGGARADALACSVAAACFVAAGTGTALELWASVDGGGRFVLAGDAPPLGGAATGASLACASGNDCLLSLGGPLVAATADGGASWRALPALPGRPRSRPSVRALACSPAGTAAATCVAAWYSLVPARAGLADLDRTSLNAAALGAGGLGLVPGALPPGLPPLTLSCASPSSCVVTSTGSSYLAWFDPERTTGLAGLEEIPIAGVEPPARPPADATDPVVTSIGCAESTCVAEVSEARLVATALATSVELLPVGAAARPGGRAPVEPAVDLPGTLDAPPAGATCASTRVCAVVASSSPATPALLLTADGGARWATVALGALAAPLAGRARHPGVGAGADCWTRLRCLVVVSLAPPAAGPLLAYETGDGGSSWHEVASPLASRSSRATLVALSCDRGGDCSLLAARPRSPRPLVAASSAGRGPFRSVPVPAPDSPVAAPRCDAGRCWMPVWRRGTAGMLEWPAGDPSRVVQLLAGGTAPPPSRELSATFAAASPGSGTLACPSPQLCVAIAVAASTEQIELVRFRPAP
ncbi:MAG TPA: hypothetical protein VKU92_03995 [Acidimicrobiales bacterium]|nr:hypothetical protein [Acidimicrobiales bacterium]